MSTPQEYWDACLIKTWRKAGSVWDALSMFESIIGQQALDVEPKLRRLPQNGFPWQIGIRVFVASHLSKISKRLWEQEPDKDVALLRKLKDSSYDTEADALKGDSEMKSEYRRYKNNKTKIEHNTRSYSQRNQATDWNVHKGPRR